MNQNYFGKLLLTGAIFMSGSLYAQKTEVQKQAILQKIKADKRVVDVQLSGERETPSLIKFGGAGVVSRSQALPQLAQYLGVRPGVDELRNIRITNGGSNFEVQEWKQFFKGIPVEKGVYKAVLRGENTLWMAGSYYDVPASLSVRATLTEQQALNSALQRINAKKYAWQQVQEMMGRLTNTGARAKMQQEFNSYLPKGELVIVKDFTKTGVAEVHLAYKFNIYAAEPLSRDWIYVEANTGKIIFKDPIIKHASVNATLPTRYAGNRTVKVKQITGNDPNSGAPLVSSHPGDAASILLNRTAYILADDTRGKGIETYDLNGVGGAPISLAGIYGLGKSFTDVDNNWTLAEHKRGPATAQNGGTDELENDDIAFDAHWGAEIVYDYWGAKHGRKSYDNNDATIFSFVHYGPAYDNAFWNGTAMTYGDGSGELMGFRALTSLDVCGHEIGHGVCSFTSDLVYEKESGAMNEGFSDIWAACVENFVIKTIDPSLASRYKPFFIGEQISYTAVPLRRMDAPKLTSNPDTYGGANFTNPDCTPTLANDQCGVHNNSGLLNKWFYLMTCGSGAGSGPDASYVIAGADDGTNDLGNAYNVNGIGFDVAEDIAYMTELLLTSTATFAEARLRSIEVATAISGNPCSALVETVTNSWYAIGVGAKFVAPCFTTFGFVMQPSTSLSEGSATGIGCTSAKSISLPVLIPANGTISATLGGTATQGVDYTNTALSFTNSTASTKLDSIVISVKNDAIVEGVESIILSLSVTNLNGNNSNNAYTISITDNDVLPTIGTGIITIFASTFDGVNGFGNPAGFAETLEIAEGAATDPVATGKNQWAINNNQLVITGKQPTPLGETTLLPGTYNTASSSQTRIATVNALDARGLNNLRVAFDYTVQGEVDVTSPDPNDPDNFPKFDYLALAYSLDGINYTEFATDSIPRLASAVPTPSNRINAPLPAFLNNQQFRLAFRWSNDANAGGPMSATVDNFLVTGLPKKIETTLNSNISENLVGGSDAYFYSQQDGDIIARINKIGSFDYGCVTANVEKAGNTTFTLYNENGTTANKVGDKVIRISPTNSSSSGTNTVSIYFTEQEIAGIESGAMAGRNSMFMYKTEASNFAGATAANTTKTPATFTAILSNGTPVGGFFTATFSTGFSAFAVGAPSAVILPVVCTNFSASQRDGLVNLQWKVASEVNNKYFEVERSVDGINFSVVATVTANAQNNGNYTTTDSKTSGLTNAYYRIRQYDLDGRSTYVCQTVNVRFGKTGAISIGGLYPNPVNNNGFVKISADKALRLQADFINVGGQTILKAIHNIAAGDNTLQVLKTKLPAGTYLLRFTDVETGAVIKTQTFVQQ